MNKVMLSLIYPRGERRGWANRSFPRMEIQTAKTPLQTKCVSFPEKVEKRFGNSPDEIKNRKLSSVDFEVSKILCIFAVKRKPPPKCTFVLSVRSFAYFHWLRPAEHCTPHRDNSYSMNSRPASPFRGGARRQKLNEKQGRWKTKNTVKLTMQNAQLKIKRCFWMSRAKPDH